VVDGSPRAGSAVLTWTVDCRRLVEMMGLHHGKQRTGKGTEFVYGPLQKQESTATRKSNATAM
jgi:hypothetical protein